MEQVTRVIKGQVAADRHGAEGTQEKIITNVEAPEAPGVSRDVVKVIRPGGIDDMWARGRITDRQRDAADRFISTYEMAHSDGVKGIDYSKLKVDCMAGGDAFMGERQFRAVKELEYIERSIGRTGYRFLVQVLVENTSIKALAARRVVERGGNERLANAYVSGRIVEALEELDLHWNTAEGAGNKMRAELGEKTTIRVELKPVDIYAHMSKEELQAHGRKVMEALQRMMTDYQRANPQGVA